MATTDGDSSGLEFEPEVLTKDDLQSLNTYDGITFPPAVRVEALKEIRSFQIRQDDVFIVTYPKSGTHWMNEIVNFLLADGDAERVNRRSSIIHIEFALIHDVGKETSNAFLFCFFFQLLKNIESRRIITSHLRYRFLPKQVDEKKTKIIYVARNPKDVFTSWFHFLKNDPRYGHLPWETYFNGALSGEYMFGSWFDHVLEFWNMREEENVLFLKYEDLKSNVRETVASIANHLNLTPTDDVIDKVVQSTSLDEMKKRYKRMETDSQDPVKIHYGKSYGINSYVRKGKIGDWKNLFTVAQNEEFDRVFQEKMKDSGLSFVFQ
nr:sulfotransferase 1A3-like [Lytechinus pictus]